MKNRRLWAFWFLILSVVFQTVAMGFGKQAAISIERYSILAVLGNPYYLAALVCMGAQAVVWLLALRVYDLSFAYFFMSGIYVGLLAMSVFVFHERVTLGNVAGAALIAVGIVIITTRQRGGVNV